MEKVKDLLHGGRLKDAEDIEALCDTVCEMDCGKLTKLRGFDEENVS